MFRKLTAGLLVVAALGGAGTAAAVAATPHSAKPVASVVRDRASLDRSSRHESKSSKDTSRDRSSRDAASPDSKSHH